LQIEHLLILFLTDRTIQHQCIECDDGWNGW